MLEKSGSFVASVKTLGRSMKVGSCGSWFSSAAGGPAHAGPWEENANTDITAHEKAFKLDLRVWLAAKRARRIPTAGLFVFFNKNPD